MKGTACPSMRVPEGVGRCFTCFRPQGSILDMAFHPQAHEIAQLDKKDAKELKASTDKRCRLLHDRQNSILIFFLRSESLRRMFFQFHRADVPIGANQGEVAWMSLPGKQIKYHDAAHYFRWLWTPATARNGLYCIDIVLVYLLKNFVLKGLTREGTAAIASK